MSNFKKINPASGAIIMAVGIFLYAAIEAFPFLNHVLGEVFTVLLTIIGIIMYALLMCQFFHKSFLVPLLNNPVNSFLMGTWIAGVSVLCNVIHKYFPETIEIIQVIAFVNTLFWVLFIGVCVYNFKQLLKDPRSHLIHGVVLLSTVATQSIIIVWEELFPFVSSYFMIVSISLGALFYVLGILLILIRYLRNTQWSLTEDWTNTNCIIHGALSITGLAIVTSNLLSPLVVLFIWLFVFTLLLIVEAIEITRAIKRIKLLGWKKGVLTYHISQWSRNFTFGMFYAFTMAMHEHSNYLSHFLNVFLTLWAWVVLIALIAEVGLLVEARYGFFERKRLEKVV
ncbi:TDT family transporter [Ornithinibacillus contaminans]|uniref:hypothetical protein n=1 Tax=Ornithinibacillus contaminans TaxID=694055 RepID=UPI00064DDAB4|nr:hypothetical protein [Ornithinibacillus contaminans]